MDGGGCTFHRRMTVSEVLSRRPELASVMEAYRMACPGCWAGALETLEGVAQAHGVDVDSLIRDLNVAALLAESGESAADGEVRDQ